MKVIQKALIKKGNKILILKRSKRDEDNPLYWDFPGGNLKRGEIPQEALIREVLEETSLKVSVGDIIGEFKINVKGEICLFKVYSTESVSGEVRVSKEHDSFRWASKEMMLNLKRVQPFVRLLLNK